MQERMFGRQSVSVIQCDARAWWVITDGGGQIFPGNLRTHLSSEGYPRIYIVPQTVTCYNIYRPAIRGSIGVAPNGL